MNKIKICQIIPMLVVGGAEKFVTDLTKGFDKNLCDVYVIVLFPSINSILEQELKKNRKQIKKLTDFKFFIDNKLSLKNWFF